jgi:hypothetical protein
MTLPPVYKIHPAIGIARLGDAAAFFIGPEVPGVRPTGDAPGTAVPPYKDGGKVKPQAARFRIFEYVDSGGKYAASREVNLADKDVTALVWTVHLANRKASFFAFDGLAGADRPPTKGRRNAGYPGDRANLDIDPKPRSISGKSAPAVEFRKGTSANPASERWPTPPPNPRIETLGTLMTDSNGRLLVLGGKGESGSTPGASAITNYSNNDGWFDDVSDGPVTAYLALKGKPVAVVPAWVICPPPDFAPHLSNVVTMYDVLYDLAARQPALPANEATYSSGSLKSLGAIQAEFKAAGKPTLSTYRPDFNTEIYPILYRAAAMKFLAKQVIGHHDDLIKWAKLASTDATHAPDRGKILTWLRQPDAKPTDTFPYMPKLLGDEPYALAAGVVHQRVRLTLTPTQYALVEQWAKGKFIAPVRVPPPAPAATITPEGIDRAALESCVGGAFFPGIEAGWQIRDPSIFQEPFRIKHGVKSPYLGDSGALKAGHFTRQMALPWQADFLQCKSENPTSGPFSGFGPWGWWPAQRPDWIFTSEPNFRAVPPKPVLWHRSTRAGATVPWATGFGGDTTTPSYEEMVNNWRKFGFVLETKRNIFTEVEREPDIP